MWCAFIIIGRKIVLTHFILRDKNKLVTKSEFLQEKKARKILIEKNNQLEDKLKGLILIEREQQDKIDSLVNHIDEQEKSNLSRDMEYMKLKEIYEDDGEISRNIGEIFANGQVWTWIKQTQKKNSVQSFYTEAGSNLLLHKQTPLLRIDKVLIRRRKDYVEFSKFDLGNDDNKGSYQNRLIMITDDLLMVRENGMMIYYLKGEHNEADIKNSDKVPLFMDYDKLFTQK
jgi:hypothetical protein